MTRVPRTTIATLLVLLVLGDRLHPREHAAAPTKAATPTAVPSARDTRAPVRRSATRATSPRSVCSGRWPRSSTSRCSAPPRSPHAARGCAARGLAYVAEHPAGAATNDRSGHRHRLGCVLMPTPIKPASRFGLPFLVVLLVLLTIAQLAGRILVRPRRSGPRARDRQSRRLVQRRLPHRGRRDGLGCRRADDNLAPGAWQRPAQHRTGSKRSGCSCARSRWSACTGCSSSSDGPTSRRGGLTKPWHDALGALAGLVAGVPLAVACFEASGSIHRSAGRTAFFAAVLAALSVVVFARASGLTMGLRISGTSSDGKTDAGLAELVRVRLHALGSRPPRGIQVTEQTDVASLPPTALSLLPDGPWRQAVSALFGLFTPSSPWLVQVTEQADSSLSVVISRNRAVVDARIIRADVIGLPKAPKPAADAKPTDPVPDWRSLALRTAAAAFVLTTLSERYRHLRLGLSGATDWRSIAAQVVATDPAVPATDDEDKTLLVRAVNFDERNLAAQAALLNLADPGIAGPLSALNTHLEELEAFSLLLTSGDQPTPGNEPLFLRTLFNIAIGRLNCVTLDPDIAAVATAEAANTKLAAAIRAQEARTGPTLDLATQMKEAMRAFVATVARYEDPEAPPADLGIGGTIQVRYGRACYFATLHRWETVLEDLTLPASLPHTRAAAQIDPSFNALHDRDIATVPAGSTLTSPAVRFKALIGAPIGHSLLDLAPFANHKAALSDLGVHTADQLLALPAHRLVLALKLAPEAAERWRAIARVHRAMASASSEADAVGLSLLLLLLDLDSPAALAAWQTAKDDPEQRHALLDAARPYAFAVPTAETLRQALAHAAQA